jgi:hypothetical protein
LPEKKKTEAGKPKALKILLQPAERLGQVKKRPSMADTDQEGVQTKRLQMSENIHSLYALSGYV